MLKQVVNKTKTLNPQIIKQFKLDDDIEIIDNLMNDINNMLKKQEKTSKQKMLLVLSSNGIKNKKIKMLKLDEIPEIEQLIRDTRKYIKRSKKFLDQIEKTKNETKCVSLEDLEQELEQTKQYIYIESDLDLESLELDYFGPKNNNKYY